MQLVRIDADGRAGGLELPELAAAVCQDTARLYADAGYEPPWVGYLAVLDGEIVGTCAFNTTTYADPGRRGVVEIAYFTFPPYEGRGVATRMAGALLEIGRAAVPSMTFVAQTEAVCNASTRVLEKLGFEFGAELPHDELGSVWEWRLAGRA